MTNVELKEQIDNDIADKTATGSITKTDVADNMKDIVDYVDQEIDTVEASLAQKADLTSTNAALATKQPTLVSGANIKTVNGNSLVGSGNVVVSGSYDQALGVSNTTDKVAVHQSGAAVARMSPANVIVTTGTDSVQLNPTGVVFGTPYTGGVSSTQLNPTENPEAGLIQLKLPETDGTLAIQKYKAYTAVISQSGTAAPEVEYVLENTIGELVLTRESAGLYKATLTGAFTFNKTIFIGGVALNHKIVRSSITSNDVYFNVYNNSSTAADDLLDYDLIEIRVYN